METIRKYVCTGIVELIGHKQGYKYLVVDDNNEITDEIAVFKKPMAGTAIIGGIYTCTNEGDSYHLGTATYIDMWQDVNQIIAWKATSDAARNLLRKQKEMIAKRADNPVHKQLEPLRRLYAETSIAERPYLLGNIISFITRGQ